ncbi:uncharacterized protein DDB_G0283357 isoform X4 [Ctenocephalides felis]|uniref:uncharacterized protein DDB_G0283357 isoform X4 n=1 Tax=Ctenocephalides felis TaxID=7515 RepID=UPI000E6E25F3|nr:uncharacterized protein DDB_G0283357 isoform X4 [Ctenocephalides felis]
MDRKKNMHNSNQNRQLNSTGAVPKAGSSREPQRDVVSRVVAPIVRETPHHNINSYNMLLEWQQNQNPEQHTSDHSHQRERFNRDFTASVESGVFEQVVNGGTLSHEQQNWLPVVRPQIRKRNQAQSGSNSNSHSMSTSTGLQQPQQHHSSSNTAIVLPTTPNMHPFTNGELTMNSNSGDIFMAPRHQDRATQVLPLINNNHSETDERLNNVQAFINSSTNTRPVCDGSSIDESNDLNAPLSNSEINDDNMKCLEMQLRMDISNRKLQVLQNQQSQLLLIQESAKMQLDKLRRHKQMEQQQLLNQQQLERGQSQQQANQTNKVFSVQSSQQFDNSNQSDRNSTTMQMHNQTDFSFQPINPMTYSLQNNENLLNPNHNENHHLHNRENTNYNCYSDGRSSNQNENIIPKHNGHGSINSDEVTSDNNHLAAGESVADHPGDFSRVDEGLMNISKRLMAIDAMMETRSEVEALTNSTFISAQGDYDEKLKELQNKKQQMDSLVADLQQLNKQAARDAELRVSRNAGSESRLSESASVPEEPLPTLRSIVGTAEGSTSSVGNEVAQISAMKVQLARLKDMMDTMKYIEARTGGSDVEDSIRSNSPRSSLCDHQSASTIETTNYAESWASSTLKPNNVDHMSQIPYKALISDNENLNSVSNWLDSDGGERSNKFPESGLTSNPSIGGLSLETVQSLSQELREQANALSAERDRLVQAQNQILSRPGRSASMSSANSFSNRSEKKVNQQVSHKNVHKPNSSTTYVPGPKEMQQQMLKAQLEAKKKELEDLMRKSRDLSLQINQTSNTSNTSSTTLKQDLPQDTNPSFWSNEQRFQSKTPTRKSSGQSASLSEVGSQRLTRRSREESESTVITSLPDIDAASCNEDFPQQAQNIPIRNASRHSNITPPVPPPMPEISFRKDSQDSSSFTSPSSHNNQTNAQGTPTWQPRLAQHLQSQFDLYFNHCQNLAMAAAAANNQNGSNQTPLTHSNSPLLSSYVQPPLSSFPNNPLTSNELGVFYQLLNSNPMVPTPPVLGATFSPYCPCNSALWQIVWMQQREITNFGRAVCSLQEHLLQLTSKASALQSSDSSTNNTSTAQHVQTSANIASITPMPHGNTNLPSQLPQNYHAQQVKIPQSNNMNNLMPNHSLVLPSTSSQNLQQHEIVTSVASNESIINRVFNPEVISTLASESTVNSNGMNYISPSFENLQYVHNNTAGQNLSTNSNNMNLQNHGQMYHNGEVCFGNVSNLANSHITLNNQVPPGNRANNYWDNFRSYSRQNLLSGNSKSSKESIPTAISQSGPSPLVTRSHNALRTVASTSHERMSLPKQNTQATSEFQINNIIQDQVNIGDVNLQRQLQNQRNQVLEIQPDVLNVNQNVLSTQFSAPGTNTPQQENAGGSCVNYPEIIQTHSSFADIAQQNLKTNLPVKSTGTNKKKSKITTVRSVNETENNQQQNAIENRPDPNLLSNENLVAQPKSTVKPFDQLREAVYGEVTALIAQNESRPQYLLQLFQNLRQVGCDPLRYQALNEIQNLVSAAPSTSPNTQAGVAPTTSNAADNPRTPLKATAKCTGAVKKGNITLRKEDCGEPLVSQTPLFTEALSNIEGSDQRCSSTTDAEQTFDQISVENEQGAVFSNSVFEDLNCADVSCSEQSSYLVAKSERNFDPTKSSNKVSDNLVSSLNNMHFSEENNIELGNVIQPSNNVAKNIPQAATNEGQNVYRANNIVDNAIPCNEDLAEADQIRISGTLNDATTSTQPVSGDNRILPELEERSRDGQSMNMAEGACARENDINMVLPLPDLARIGPGGDHDITETNRSVSTSGFDHGLDRVPTRLTNGPWSPESSINDSSIDTSMQSSIEE